MKIGSTIQREISSIKMNLSTESLSLTNGMANYSYLSTNPTAVIHHHSHILISSGAQWDGTTLQWFLRDYEALKISGKRHVFVSFTIDDKKKLFTLVPNSTSPSIPDTFEFTTSYLYGTGSTQRWRITGEVPIPIVMCLVIIRYLRKGSQQFVRSSISDTGIYPILAIFLFSDTNSTNSENVFVNMSTSTSNLNVTLSYESNCMLKLGNSKGWKKRWCVLKPNDNILYCWKSQEVCF